MRFGLTFFPPSACRTAHGGLLPAVPAHRRARRRARYSSIKTVEHSFYDYGGHSPNPCVFLSRWRRAPAHPPHHRRGDPAFHHPAHLGGDLAMPIT